MMSSFSLGWGKVVSVTCNQYCLPPSVYLWEPPTCHISPCVTWPCVGPHLVTHWHPSQAGLQQLVPTYLTASCLFGLSRLLCPPNHWAPSSARKHRQVRKKKKRTRKNGLQWSADFLRYFQPCIWLKLSDTVPPGMLGTALSNPC